MHYICLCQCFAVSEMKNLREVPKYFVNLFFIKFLRALHHYSMNEEECLFFLKVSSSICYCTDQYFAYLMQVLWWNLTVLLSELYLLHCAISLKIGINVKKNVNREKLLWGTFVQQIHFLIGCKDAIFASIVLTWFCIISEKQDS